MLKQILCIYISNVNDNIYLKLINDEDDISRIIYPSDLVDNTYKYKVPDTSIIRSYFIKVYSNVDNCIDEEIRTIEIKIPMYNYLSETRLCENNDAYYCSKYINTPLELDTWELLKQQNKEDQTIIENIDESKNNKSIYIYISIIGVSIILLIIILIIIKKKHKKKLLNKAFLNNLKLLLFIFILNFGIISNINAYSVKYIGTIKVYSGGAKTYHSQYRVDNDKNKSAYCIEPPKDGGSNYIEDKGKFDPDGNLYSLALTIGYYKSKNQNGGIVSAVFRLISEYYGELGLAGKNKTNSDPYRLRKNSTVAIRQQYWRAGAGQKAFNIFKSTIDTVNAASGKTAKEKYNYLIKNYTIFKSSNIKFTVDGIKVKQVGNNQKDVSFKINKTNDPYNLVTVNWTDFKKGLNVNKIVEQNKNEFTVRINSNVQNFQIIGNYTTDKNIDTRIKIIKPSSNASEFQRMILVNKNPTKYTVTIPVSIVNSSKCTCEVKNGVNTGNFVYTLTKDGTTTTEVISKDDKRAQQLNCPKCEVPHKCEVIYDSAGKPTYYAKDGSITDKQTYKKQCLHICETPDQNEEHVYYCSEKVENKDGEKCSENEYLDECYCPPLKEKCENDPNNPECTDYKEKCPNCDASISIPDSCNDFDTNSSIEGKIDDINQVKTECNNFANEVKRCVIGGKDQAENSYEAITELNNNKYCKVWCNENYEFDIPTARYSLSGGYFTLTSQISGTRNCYVSSASNSHKPIDSIQFEEDIKKLNQEITGAYAIWQANKNDSNYKKLTDLNEQMKNTISEFNNCSIGWQNNMKFDPTIEFSYHEEEYSKIGTGKFTRSSDVITTITDTYCLGDTDDQYQCLNGALVSDSDNVPNGLYKNLTYVSCDVNGCINNNTVVSQAKWIQKTKTQSAIYTPNQNFSTYHQYGTVKTGTVCENANIEGYNNCLWTRLPATALPVELKTLKGAFPFTLKFSNIGQSNKDGSLGRLIGDDNSVLNKYNELPEARKCGLNQGFEQDIGYVCAYVNNCPECDVACAGENCKIKEECDGVCPVNCKNCIFDGKNTRYLFRTVSLNSLFPNLCENENSNECRQIGYNWSTYKAQETRKQIEQLGDNIYDEPEYSYTLTSYQMANIRRFNKNANTYANVIIPQNEENAGANALQCDQITDSKSGLQYSVRCKSTFLDSTSGEYFTQNVKKTEFVLWQESDYCINNNCVLSREDGIGPSWK